MLRSIRNKVLKDVEGKEEEIEKVIKEIKELKELEKKTHRGIFKEDYNT